MTSVKKKIMQVVGPSRKRYTANRTWMKVAKIVMIKVATYSRI